MTFFVNKSFILNEFKFNRSSEYQIHLREASISKLEKKLTAFCIQNVPREFLFFLLILLLLHFRVNFNDGCHENSKGMAFLKMKYADF